jgi:RHS repeat-associated protein
MRPRLDRKCSLSPFLRKIAGSETTTYVYDAFGRLAAEYSTSGPTQATGRYFRTTDHLGSTRLVTDGSGNVYDRRDFFPFGESLSGTAGNRQFVTGYNNTDPASDHMFTGKERDGESGLDYFLARYMSASMGRFTSADAPFVDQNVGNPQSWNLYGYVRNSPLAYIDEDGRLTKEAPKAAAKRVVTISYRAAVAQAAGRAATTIALGPLVAGAAILTLLTPQPLGAPELEGSRNRPVASSGDPDAPDFVGPPDPTRSPKKKSSSGSDASSGADSPFDPSAENLDRMRQGRAPLDGDGNPVRQLVRQLVTGTDSAIPPAINNLQDRQSAENREILLE